MNNQDQTQQGQGNRTQKPGQRQDRNQAQKSGQKQSDKNQGERK